MLRYYDKYQAKTHIAFDPVAKPPPWIHYTGTMSYMRRADAVLESYKQNRKLHIRRYVDRTEYIEVETWY